LIAGTGVEFEKNENLWLTSLGIEYGCELPKGWEAGAALMWDDKWGNYNSWVFEFSFSKTFFKKRKEKLATAEKNVAGGGINN